MTGDLANCASGDDKNQEAQAARKRFHGYLSCKMRCFDGASIIEQSARALT
jgi:hypothetical protein